MIRLLGCAALGSLLCAKAVQPQVPIIPNASRVQAQVMKYSIWDGSLLGTSGGRTVYSLLLQVCSSRPAGREASLVAAGDRVEAFSNSPLSPDLFGRAIEATVWSQGDEHGQRFWIRDIEAGDSGAPCYEGEDRR